MNTKIIYYIVIDKDFSNYLKNKTPIIIPIRSILTGKQRLRKHLGNETNKIIMWMLEELLKKIKSYPNLAPIILTKNPDHPFFTSLKIPVITDNGQDLNSSLQYLLQDINENTNHAIILLGDVPTLKPQIIHATTILLNQYAVVTVPTMDNGTALLGLQLPHNFPLSFGEDSYQKFMGTFEREKILNVQIKQNNGLIDIDDINTLQQLELKTENILNF